MTIAFARLQGEKLAMEMEPSGPPINVKKIATQLGIQIIEADLGAGVSGLLITHPEQTSICVQKNDPPKRKRFTIAHEIAHHILGHQFEAGEHVHVDHGNIVSQRSVRASQGVDSKEIEANQFAASMLMPSSWIRAQMAHIPGPLTDQHVTDLAKKFEVSEQAMTIRLTTLRVL